MANGGSEIDKAVVELLLEGTGPLAPIYSYRVTYEVVVEAQTEIEADDEARLLINTEWFSPTIENLGLT